MSKMVLQRLFLVLGVVGLVVVLVDLGISIAATFPSATPARVDQVTAGPYHLAVSFGQTSHAGSVNYQLAAVFNYRPKLIACLAADP